MNYNLPFYNFTICFIYFITVSVSRKYFNARSKLINFSFTINKILFHLKKTSIALSRMSRHRFRRIYTLDALRLSFCSLRRPSRSSSLLRTLSFLRMSRRQCRSLVETANSRWRTVNEGIMAILETAWN